MYISTHIMYIHQVFKSLCAYICSYSGHWYTGYIGTQCRVITLGYIVVCISKLKNGRCSKILQFWVNPNSGTVERLQKWPSKLWYNIFWKKCKKHFFCKISKFEFFLQAKVLSFEAKIYQLLLPLSQGVIRWSFKILVIKLFEKKIFEWFLNFWQNFEEHSIFWPIYVNGPKEYSHIYYLNNPYGWVIVNLWALSHQSLRIWRFKR